MRSVGWWRLKSRKIIYFNESIGAIKELSEGNIQRTGRSLSLKGTIYGEGTTASRKLEDYLTKPSS